MVTLASSNIVLSYRLLLVIQCCVSELESARGHKLTNIPFTLGSAVKRLSKCVIQNTSHLVELTEQVPKPFHYVVDELSLGTVSSFLQSPRRSIPLSPL